MINSSKECPARQGRLRGADSQALRALEGITGILNSSKSLTSRKRYGNYKKSNPFELLASTSFV
jgi:hypothetical protein